MKIVFDTSTCTNLTENFYVHSLGKIPNLFIKDLPDFSEYTHALFMQSSKTKLAMKKAREENPNISMGLVDPRGEGVSDYIKDTDFIVVNGVEKSDYFCQWQPNCFLYYDYPELEEVNIQDEESDKFIIGYHGNKVHLGSMFPHVTQALEELGKKYPIEFWAMYNIENLGPWKAGVPKNIEVKHIQWSEENYKNLISKTHVGLIPCQTPLSFPSFIRRFLRLGGKTFLETKIDHLLRFKVPSSFGRAFVFAHYKIPVICDFIPSGSHFIKHGFNGYIANRSGGWYAALEKLIVNKGLRKALGENLFESTKEIRNIAYQNKNFLNFLNELPSQKTDGLGDFKEFCFLRFLRFKTILWLEEVAKLKKRIIKKLLR